MTAGIADRIAELQHARRRSMGNVREQSSIQKSYVMSKLGRNFNHLSSTFHISPFSVPIFLRIYAFP